MSSPRNPYHKLSKFKSRLLIENEQKFPLGIWVMWYPAPNGMRKGPPIPAQVFRVSEKRVSIRTKAGREASIEPCNLQIVETGAP